MSDRIRAIVADDERPARSFLSSMLRRRPDVDIVGEAETGVEAVSLIERERPDLAFLEIDTAVLRGRARPERIFALLGDEVLATSPDFQRLKGAISEVRAAIAEANRALALGPADAMWVMHAGSPQAPDTRVAVRNGLEI